MNIGIYVPPVPPQIGGGYRFIEEVLEALKVAAPASGHQFTVFTRLRRPEFDESNSALQYSLIPTFPLEKVRVKFSPFWMRFARHAAPKLNCEDPFTRWVKSAGIDFMFYPTQTALTTEIPYAVMVWDLQHRLQPFFPEVSAEGVWQAREEHFRVTLRRAAYVVAGTEAGKHEIERFFGVATERLRTLPHPTPRFALNPPPLDTSLLSRYQLPNDFLFYPAQFWAHKNHVTILHALRRLRDEHGVNQTIVFTGSDQGNEAYIRGMTNELGLAHQVKFLGFLPFEDIVQLYRCALGLCYMSFFGPENLPPLEAFGLECPVIASRVTGAEEQLGDAVLSVDPRDDRQLTEAILRLRREPQLRAELIARGKERARAFTTFDFVRGMLAICDEFANFRRCWKAA